MERVIKRYANGMAFLILQYTKHIPSHLIRNMLYRIQGLNFGLNTTIYSNVMFRSPHKIVIGDNTVIGHDCLLDGRGGLKIGDNVNFSRGAYVFTMQHDKNDPYFSGVKGKVEIDDYAWISSRTTILPNIYIGKGAVIAAGAVVTRSVEPYSIVGGVPAEKIGHRNEDLRYNLAKGLPFI
jgi:acetyltransferase-like isoleucine patch superfamily enzyme